MFFHLAAGAAALPFPRSSQRRKPIRRGRCASSWALPRHFADTSARLIAQWLSERLGQQFIMRTGRARHQYRYESVVKAAPDGYTLLMVGCE